MQEYTLQIGEQAYLQKAFLRPTYAMIYAGMPSAEAFSIAISTTYGNQASKLSLFIPKDQREFRYKEWRVAILDVRPDQIRVRIENA